LIAATYPADGTCPQSSRIAQSGRMVDFRPGLVICPLLSGPISILEMAAKEEWNGKEAQT
jgi:hypothetical protein